MAGGWNWGAEGMGEKSAPKAPPFRLLFDAFSIPNRILFEAFWDPKGKAARRSACSGVAKCCIWGVGFRVRGSGFSENREWARVPASPRRAFRVAGKLLGG